MKRKVLILGGNGFIGSNLAKRLVESGYAVKSFDLSMPINKVENVEYLCGDFFDDIVLESILEGVELVYHAISTLNPSNSNVRYMQGYSRDFIQTIKLCELVIKKKIKLIFLSSGGTVYGRQEHMPISEETFPQPINHYGNVKLCIENTIRTFNMQLNAKMIIVRISNPYGPGQDYQKGVGFIDAALKNSINNKKIEIWGDGLTERDYIYIDDVCGMLSTLAGYEGDEEVFNISSGRGCSQKEIIDIVRSLGLEPEVEYKAGRSVDVRRIILDNHKIRTIYKGSITGLEEGILKYYRYLSGE